MKQIVGIFSDKISAESACNLLSGADYKLGKYNFYSLDDSYAFKESKNEKKEDGKNTVKFLDNGDVTLKLAVKGTIIGAGLFFIVSFFWAWLMFDDISTRVLISSTVWKCGAVIGAFVGIYWAYERGLTPEYNSYYLQNLKLGKILVAVQPKHSHANVVRGILIESGAQEVRDLKATMEISLQVAKSS